MSRLLISVYFINVALFSFGQEKVGISLDPRSGGYYSIFTNPANSAYYTYDWHVNAFGSHFFAHTDYATISNTSAFDLLGNYNKVEIVGRPSDIQENSNLRQVIFDRDGGRKTGATVANILWPGGIWRKSKTEMLGAFIKSNAIGSFFRLPEALGYYEAADIRQNPTVIDLFTTSYMVWTDIGLHYSSLLHQSKFESSAIGLNARLVIPHEGAQFELNKDPVYNRIDTLFTVSGLATSSKYTDFGYSNQSIRINGIGLAIDLGFHETKDHYSYGVTLLDFGFAYYGRNALSYDIKSDSTVTYNSAGIIDHNDLDEIINDVDFQLDTQIYQQVRQGASFLMGLPTALSLQYHRRISEKWTIGAILTQRFPFFPNSARRPNSLAMVPRFRSGILDLSLPISIFEYQDIRIGAAIEYGYFILGSDDILSLAGRNNFSGTDFYFGIQIYPFRKARKNREVQCFRF